MFNSKFYTVMFVITFVFVAAAVAFQVLEMNDYGILPGK